MTVTAKIADDADIIELFPARKGLQEQVHRIGRYVKAPVIWEHAAYLLSALYSDRNTLDVPGLCPVRVRTLSAPNGGRTAL